MSLTVAATLVVVLVLGVLIASYRQDAAERWWNRIVFVRRTVAFFVMVLLAATFVQSGNPLLIAVTFALVLVAALYIAVEEPHKDVV